LLATSALGRVEKVSARECEIEILNKGIQVNDYLNQDCLFVFDLESILLRDARKIPFLTASTNCGSQIAVIYSSPIIVPISKQWSSISDAHDLGTPQFFQRTKGHVVGW